MQKLVEGLRDRLAQGQNAMLCTIIESRGSAPRGAGACMAILADGSFLGTIGGGVMEYRAQQRGQELLAAGRSQVDAFSLNAKDSANIGMICGGNGCFSNIVPLQTWRFSRPWPKPWERIKIYGWH